MKHLLLQRRYKWMLAVLLTLTGCKDYDDVAETSPASHEPVKTQFSIAVSGVSHGSKTRMVGDALDGYRNGIFSGMHNIRLYPFIAQPKDDEDPTPTITSDLTAIGPGVTLAVTGATPAIPEANAIGENSNSSFAQFYANVQIPVGTNSFLFYGEPLPPAGIDMNSPAAWLEYGKTNTVFPNSPMPSPKDIRFDLQPIYIPDDATVPPDKAQALCDYLTEILNVETNGLPEGERDKLKKNTTGSSASVLQMVSELYKQPGISADVKAAILGENNCHATDDGNGALTFNDGSLKGYPGELGLPDGAARMICKKNEQNKDVFQPIVTDYTENSTDPSATPLSVAGLNTYAYPAALYYHANSPIAVATTAVEHPNANEAWADYLNSPSSFDFATNSFGEMASDVKAVALVNEVTYGVARLNLTVQSNERVLKDCQVTGEEQNELDVQEYPFPITGVMISGQTDCDYQFYPKGSLGSNWTIYDQVPRDEQGLLPSNMKLMWNNGAAPSGIISTLVLPTAAVTNPDEEETIQVAVEFENTSSDFRGADGQLIAKGTKFYLIGRMKVSDGTKPEGSDINRVFAPGYETTAHFTVTTLENAYNAVPDLRVAALKISLDVNLNWQKGTHHTTTIE